MVKGADPSSRDRSGRTPLFWAVLNEHETVAKYLSEGNADVNTEDQDHWTPLTTAIKGGNYSMVALLLDLGANLSAPSSDGLTAIHVAMDREDNSIMDLSMRRCSDTYVGQRGWTRLHLAAINGNKESVRQQLEEGADRAARDQKGLMPLHWAAAQSHEEVVQLLLEMNTEIDEKDDEGMTALHHAASKDNVRIVRALLEKGAKRDVTDLHDWTPSMIAQMYAKDDICNTLLGGTETTTMPGTRAGLTPSCWVKEIGPSNITISKDRLTVISDNIGLRSKSRIRADHPMPAGAYTFYFEVTIVNAGRENIVGLGFCEGGAPRRGMPGWSHGSWGYHGDDGKKFSDGKQGVSYSDKYGTGDIVGCGVDFNSNCAFFTKNGKKLGRAFEDVTGRLYPEIGIGSLNVEVTVNFGQNEFLFQEPS